MSKDWSANGSFPELDAAQIGSRIPHATRRHEFGQEIDPDSLELGEPQVLDKRAESTTDIKDPLALNQLRNPLIEEAVDGPVEAIETLLHLRRVVVVVLVAICRH